MTSTHQLNPKFLTWMDSAIEAVASEEYTRLSQGLTNEEVAQHVANAMRELKKLNEGKTPNYDDEWVALFYLTWYFPRQVHLISRCFLDGKIPIREQALVIDLGCGALSTLFAMVIVSASLRVGSRILFIGIDQSQSMRRIGTNLWNYCRRSCHKKGTDFCEIVNSVQTFVWDSFRNFMQSENGGYSWMFNPIQIPDSNEYYKTHEVYRNATYLTSFHAAYHFPKDLRAAVKNLFSVGYFGEQRQVEE